MDLSVDKVLRRARMALENKREDFSSQSEKDTDGNIKHYVTEKFHRYTDGTSLHGIKYIANRSSSAQARYLKFLSRAQVFIGVKTTGDRGTAWGLSIFSNARKVLVTMMS